MSLMAKRRGLTGAVFAAALVTGAFAATAASAQTCHYEEEGEGDENRVFSSKVGEIVLRAQEAFNIEDWATAMQELNSALGERNISPYETGIILQLRGAVKYNQDDAAGALQDWSRSISEGNHKFRDCLNLMYNVGQLHLSEGNYRTAVDKLEEWLRLGGEANDKVHLNMVAAYVELGDLRNALRHARTAKQLASPVEKRHFDTLNYLYTELDMPAERAELLSEYVVLFPTEKSVWLSIAALHAQAGRERKAFEINKIMYLNGMYTTENEIMRVVDYYSYYEVPYRGAVILEREMNRGRVEGTRDNYEKLARLYRQANEFDRAIPALERAASMAPNGENYRALGEALYAEGRLAEAERALSRAIQRGGLDDTGDALIVLGNAQYEQGHRKDAIDTFTSAERYPASRNTARSWREFVENEILAEENRVLFRIETRKEEVRVFCRRALADIVIYNEMISDPDYDGPDCPAVVNDDDFTSRPEIIAMEEDFNRQFRQTEVADSEGADAEGGDAGDDAVATDAAPEGDGAEPEGDSASETDAGQ